MTAVSAHVKAQQQRYLDELSELLRIPSISTDPGPPRRRPCGRRSG